MLRHNALFTSKLLDLCNDLDVAVSQLGSSPVGFEGLKSHTGKVSVKPR
jgi:hypothetical protein